MDEEAFNLSVRSFLKKLGVTSQREIELAVREQLDAGGLKGDETLGARAVVTVDGLEREIVVSGEITLSGEPSGSRRREGTGRASIVTRLRRGLTPVARQLDPDVGAPALAAGPRPRCAAVRARDRVDDRQARGRCRRAGARGRRA